MSKSITTAANNRRGDAIRRQRTHFSEAMLTDRFEADAFDFNLTLLVSIDHGSNQAGGIRSKLKRGHCIRFHLEGRSLYPILNAALPDHPVEFRVDLVFQKARNHDVCFPELSKTGSSPRLSFDSRVGFRPKCYRQPKHSPRVLGLRLGDLGRFLFISHFAACLASTSPFMKPSVVPCSRH